MIGNYRSTLTHKAALSLYHEVKTTQHCQWQRILSQTEHWNLLKEVFKARSAPPSSSRLNMVYSTSKSVRARKWLGSMSASVSNWFSVCWLAKSANKWPKVMDLARSRWPARDLISTGNAPAIDCSCSSWTRAQALSCKIVLQRLCTLKCNGRCRRQQVQTGLCVPRSHWKTVDNRRSVSRPIICTQFWRSFATKDNIIPVFVRNDASRLTLPNFTLFNNWINSSETTSTSTSTSTSNNAKKGIDYSNSVCLQRNCDSLVFYHLQTPWGSASAGSMWAKIDWSNHDHDVGVTAALGEQACAAPPFYRLF